MICYPRHTAPNHKGFLFSQLFRWPSQAWSWYCGNRSLVSFFVSVAVVIFLSIAETLIRSPNHVTVNVIFTDKKIWFWHSYPSRKFVVLILRPFIGWLAFCSTKPCPDIRTWLLAFHHRETSKGDRDWDSQFSDTIMSLVDTQLMTGLTTSITTFKQCNIYVHHFTIVADIVSFAVSSSAAGMTVSQEMLQRCPIMLWYRKLLFGIFCIFRLTFAILQTNRVDRYSNFNHRAGCLVMNDGRRSGRLNFKWCLGDIISFFWTYWALLSQPCIGMSQLWLSHITHSEE